MAYSTELREAGKPYPRTCQDCGLGPCKRTQPVTSSAGELPEEPHTQGKWCANLRCSKCYAADTWQKSEVEALRARLAEVERELHIAKTRLTSEEAMCRYAMRGKADAERQLSVALADAEAMERRYLWAVNALMACDYGDNESESITGNRQVGWHVYGWRTRNGELKIYGSSMREAIDQYLAEHPGITKEIEAAMREAGHD